MAAEPAGQLGWKPLPVPPEQVFDSKDVETYLWEVTRDFMADIKGDQRGISWAATLFRLGQARTVAAGTEKAREADREQCSFADGPVMEALRSGEFVLLSDVSRDRRWPGYANAAAGHGVQSLLSVPIASEGGTSAAINLYAAFPHAFSSDDLLRSRSYARQVARALRVVVRVAERAEATAGIAVVQSSLVLVDLAVRSLMDEYGLSREGALRFLQTQALHHELDLRGAALNIVAPGPGREQRARAADAGSEPSGLGPGSPEGVADFRVVPPAELDHEADELRRAGGGADTDLPPTAEGRTA
ncbi:GAF domain-containing protein [Pseudarthrobacter sp. NamE5]|uniref:GAF domain-containing protein n=1 Tax=Pseudarthrobacter sp. NamE5 TaxID=2576839 RepID=UPI00110B6131|nr:GAF domain-containing protein [Pseudarthrobacter sp. NamE5]TLM88123.1 GAF domain-containing protein [Pseudarthrobacter sp. NamE5]